MEDRCLTVGLMSMLTHLSNDQLVYPIPEDGLQAANIYKGVLFKYFVSLSNSKFTLT